jgi:hypothetical protein
MAETVLVNNLRHNDNHGSSRNFQNVDFYSTMCGNLPQCQADGLNSFSVCAKETILTPTETVNSTYIYTACDRVRASQPALISEASTLIG